MNDIEVSVQGTSIRVKFGQITFLLSKEQAQELYAKLGGFSGITDPEVAS